MERYDFKTIEPKWQKQWKEKNLFKTDSGPDKSKFYCLDFFPYPSGDGLSVGHCRNYIPTDVVCRYKRMQDYNVLHPMGWDAFGLPAENEAIEKGLHPKIIVPKYIANYKRQLNLIGCSYDWEREINSSTPEYYRWTQWFFLLLYKRGLAYRATAQANFCPKCKTVLANEEVENEMCWRCHTTVTKKDLKQWFFKITDYAESLLNDLEIIEWPESIVLMQKNWIGRSEGVEFNLKIKDREETISIFTTRPDTIYGMTFCVLAPEHPLVEKLTTPENREEVTKYVEKAKIETEIERLSTERKPTGVFIGSYAVNPMNGDEIPIYIGDYVLMGYGTGAIMSVPAHDTRDFEFAHIYKLPIKVVIEPPEWDGELSKIQRKEAYTEEGRMINSGEFTNLPSKEGIEKIADCMEEKGIGKRAVYYRMRDWLISRQRYWGAPIPIVYCKKCGEVPVPEDQLPVLLPDVEKYQPSGTGRSPLANVKEFVKTKCPQCGGEAERETDTMGGFACSSWYFLRFASPHYDKGAFRKEDVSYWMPVDLYVGGAEHAVMHLLYARFWTKVAADAGLIDFREPFAKLMNQGMLHASDGKLMSKSAGNVITPDSIVEKYGADTLRIYELFLAPFEQNVIWSEDAINGSHRFLNRIWKLVIQNRRRYDPQWRDFKVTTPQEKKLRQKTHRTIKKVTEDIEHFKFNTAIAAMMEWINEIKPDEVSDKGFSETIENFLLILSPFAPHISEELWERLGKKDSISLEVWPTWSEKEIEVEELSIPVQINGKLRDVVIVPVEATEEELKETVLSSEKVRRWVEGKKVEKFIIVKKRLVSLVVKDKTY